MTEISDLPPKERAARYRALAEDATRQAARVGGERVRDSYRMMAAQWTRLAEEADGLAAKADGQDIDKDEHAPPA
jgi:hypothetical protein